MDSMQTSSAARVSPAKAKTPYRGEPLLKRPAPPATKTVKPTAAINAVSRIVEVPYDLRLPFGGEDLPPGRIEISMAPPTHWWPRPCPRARVGRHQLHGDAFRGSIGFGETYISLDEVEHFVTALLEVATRTRLVILGTRIDEPGRDLATGKYDWDKYALDMRAIHELENADRDYGDEQPEGRG